MAAWDAASAAFVTASNICVACVPDIVQGQQQPIQKMEKPSKVQSQIQSVASRKLEAIALKSNQSNLHVQVNPKCGQGSSKIAKLLPGQFTSNDCKKEHQGNCYGVTYYAGWTFSSWWIGFCPPLSPHQRVANLDPWAPLPCGFFLELKAPPKSHHVTLLDLCSVK
jgi:hypothetical protein